MTKQDKMFSGPAGNIPLMQVCFHARKCLMQILNIIIMNNA